MSGSWATKSNDKSLFITIILMAKLSLEMVSFLSLSVYRSTLPVI